MTKTVTFVFIDRDGRRSCERFDAADALAELRQYRASLTYPVPEHTLIVDHDGVAHVFRSKP